MSIIKSTKDQNYKIDIRVVFFRILVILLFYSSIAQSVEHSAVNRVVVGSSPTRGAYIKKSEKQID